MTTRGIAWPAAALTVLLWASAFAAIRAALEAFSTTELTVLRLALASVALGALTPAAGVRRPAVRDLPALLACGATGMAGYQLLLNAGEQTVSAGTASMLVNTGPLFGALLARLLLHEQLIARTGQGLAVAFGGTVVIALGQRGGVSLSGGALLVLGAAASLATFFVLQKPLLSRYTAFEVTSLSTWAATLMVLPLGGGVAGAVADADARSVGAVLFLGLGASALGFFSWAHALSRLPVTTLSASLYTVPLVAVVVAFVWLDEVPPAASFVGGAVTLVGVARATRPARRDSTPGPANDGRPLTPRGSRRTAHLRWRSRASGSSDR